MNDLMHAKRLDFSRFAICAFVSWGAAAAYLSMCRLWPNMASPWFSLVLGIASVVVLAAGLRTDKGNALRTTSFVLSSALIMISLSSLAAHSNLHTQVLFSDRGGEMCFRLEEDLIARDGSYQVLASYLDDHQAEHMVMLKFHEDPGLLLHGETIRSSVSLRLVDACESYYWGKKVTHEGIVYSYSFIKSDPVLSWPMEARREVILAFDQHGGDRAGILQALICGYRGGIESSGEYEQYKIVGLAHMIAVSGSHLAIVASFVQLLLMRMSIGARARCAATILIMSLYYVFTGCSVSALRSLIMVIAGLCSLFSERRGSSLDALAACVIGFIAFDPFVALSVSFALSAGSTLGIILFSGLLSEALGMRSRGLKLFVGDPIALCLASNITTLLFSAALFSQLSLVSVLANVLIAPLFTFSCLIGLASACVLLVLPFAAGPAVHLASLAMAPMQRLVFVLSGFPYAAIPFEANPAWMIALSILLSVMLYMWWPMPQDLRLGLLGFSCALLLLCAVMFVYLSSHDELIMLDVGQGDCLVLRSEGAALMVDTGTNDTMLRQAMARNGVYSLDAVAITHPDDDHCGSLQSLAKSVVIERVILHEGVENCGCDSCSDLLLIARGLHGSPELVFVGLGDVVEVGDFSCTVVWPQEFKAEGGNADSLSLLVDHADSHWRGLLVGDAESAEVEAMVSGGALGRIDYLKLGHHGSAGSLDEGSLALLPLRLALVSVGANNRYGHPNEAVVDLLHDHQVDVLRTDLHGDVRLRFTDGEIKVKAQVSLG